MKHVSPTKKIAFAVIVGVVVVSAYLLLFVFKQVTEDQARQYNRDFAAEVKADVAAIPGYEVVRSGQSEPSAVKDEMSATDYYLSASFLLRKLPAGSTSETIEADVNQLKLALPTTDYSISVENTQANGKQPPLLCVTADRYLNNDGHFVVQPSAGNRGRYISAADAPQLASAGCNALLK